MITADTFVAAAKSAGYAVAALASLDPSIAHQDGEPTALVAVADGLVYGGYNPHFEGSPWFLSDLGLDLRSQYEADTFYAALC